MTARGPEFQFYGQALQAAVDGLGIAMGIRPYIDDDLAAGRLVAPFALTVPKGMRWYLAYRSFQTEQRDFVDTIKSSGESLLTNKSAVKSLRSPP